MLGHCYSPFMKFKGGKGVATGFGMFLILMPKIAIIAVIIFALVVYFSKYVSLASIIAASSIPVLYFLISDGPNGLVLFCTIAAAGFITARHIENIERLKTGKESKLEFKSSSKQANLANSN